jgi:uncharacterized protein (DUF2141 family)
MKKFVVFGVVLSAATVATVLAEGRVEYRLDQNKKVVGVGYDTNGNGKLDPGEDHPKGLAVEGTRDGQRVVFVGIDENGDGSLTGDELKITLTF